MTHLPLLPLMGRASVPTHAWPQFMQRLLGEELKTPLSMVGAHSCLFFLYPFLCLHSFLRCRVGVPCVSLPTLYFPRSRVLPDHLSYSPGTPEGGGKEGGGSLRSLLGSLPIVRILMKGLFVDHFPWNIWFPWNTRTPFPLGAWYTCVAQGGDGGGLQGVCNVP